MIYGTGQKDGAFATVGGRGKPKLNKLKEKEKFALTHRFGVSVPGHLDLLLWAWADSQSYITGVGGSITIASSLALTGPIISEDSHRLGPSFLSTALRDTSDPNVPHWGWRDGSSGKSTCCSWTESKFSSQQTWRLKALCRRSSSLLASCGYCTHMVHAGKINTHKIKNNKPLFKKKCRVKEHRTLHSDWSTWRTFELFPESDVK